MRTLAKRSAQLCAEGVKALQAGEFGEARRLYEAALALRPADPDALNYLGVVRHLQGQTDAAVRLIERSLSIAPENPHAWLNLGNLWSALEQNRQAKAAYERASVLAPDFADVWLNLGVCLRALEERAAAVAALDRAVQLRPTHVSSRYQRGVAQREAGELAAAESDYRAVLELDAGYAYAYESLGVLLMIQNRIADAAKVYRSWLEHDPQSAVAKHLAAAMSGDEIPERASDRYIVQTFDQYAPSFERSLQSLGYRAPELVSSALREAAADSLPLRSVLDAGCGTGLCGTLLRPMAQRLTGVDLSNAMLEQARTKGCYDELSADELCAFMRRHPAEFDAVVAADTLVYFGALEEALAGCALCLEAGGHLVITLERMASDASARDYRIEPHGRYSHRLEYVYSVLEQSGIERIGATEQVLRRERGEDVCGLLVTGRRGRATAK